MIKLIIDTSTNTIFNSFEYSGEGPRAEDYILSWTSVKGECVVPPGFWIEEVDDFCIEKRLPAKDGFRTEFRYDFSTKAVYELYIVESYLITGKISELTQELSTTDYKVIKAYEASLVGEPVPYDFTEVHAKRQALRDKINELENLLKQEGGKTYDPEVE